MKKSVKRMMSAFMALAMVLSLGMSLGSVTASATEIEEVVADEATVAENGTVVLPAATSRVVYNKADGWCFKHQRDTGTFSANAGDSINFVITGIQSGSTSRFTVNLCRYVINSDGKKVAQTVGGPILQEANQSSSKTITFQAPYTESEYFIRCLRDSEIPEQNFSSVKVVVIG